MERMIRSITTARRWRSSYRSYWSDGYRNRGCVGARKRDCCRIEGAGDRGGRAGKGNRAVEPVRWGEGQRQVSGSPSSDAKSGGRRLQAEAAHSRCRRSDRDGAEETALLPIDTRSEV